MKKKSSIRIFSIMLSGLIMILVNGCSKGDETATTVTDIDGNIYKTISVGTQVWMAENLKTTKYRNGDIIPTTNPATKDISGESTPKYQWAYAGTESNVAVYGRLYTWFAAMDNRNVCPTGWHLPTDAEWTTLSTFMGGESVAGGKLKESGTAHWVSPNTAATNQNGWSALPAGYRSYLGSITFTGIGSYGNWWSSTEATSGIAVTRGITCDGSSILRSSDNGRNGESVRCLKDK